MHTPQDSHSSVSIHPAQLKTPAYNNSDKDSRLAPRLVIHVSDTLGKSRRNDLEIALGNRSGINEVQFNATHPHLLLVDYDPQQLSSLEVLQKVWRENLHAQLIGPI